MIPCTALAVATIERVNDVFGESGCVERVGGTVGFVGGVPEEEVGTGFDVVDLFGDGGGVLVGAKERELIDITLN